MGQHDEVGGRTVDRNRRQDQSRSRTQDPLTELRALWRGLAGLIGSVGAPAASARLRNTLGVELAGDADRGWTLVARLPGVAPEDVDLRVADRELRIRAAESAGPLEHRVVLPAPVDLDRVDAVMEHGLLTVVMPPAPGSAPRTVAVRRPGPVQKTPSGIRRPSTGGTVDPAADRELHHPDVARGTGDRLAG